MQPSSQRIEYANWWSKFLFQKSFENQFVVPLPIPKLALKGMEFFDRQFFTPDFKSISIDRPIFILGLPRSGTSLLYNLLCDHEQSAFVSTTMNSFPTAIGTIHWLIKTFNFNIRGERFLKDSMEADFLSPSEPAMFWGKWIGRDLHSLYWPEKRIHDFTPEKILEIQMDIKRVIATYQTNATSSIRFITKSPVFQTELRMIQDLFPDAHFIHIVRDGRMVANSLVKLHHLVNHQITKIKHPDLKYMVPYPRLKNLEEYVNRFGADDIRCTAHVWQDSIQAVKAVQNELKYFTEIRYEDLLLDPKNELNRLFSFLDLPWPHSSNLKFKKDFESIGKISHKNNYGHFEIIENIASRTLQEYRY